MKKIYLYLAIISLLLSPISVSGNNIDDNVSNVQSSERGIDLDSCAFAIPVEQLNFNSESQFTLSFWASIKDFEYDKNGIRFVSIRDVTSGMPTNNWGWMWSEFRIKNNDVSLEVGVRSNNSGSGYIANEMALFEFNPSEWIHFSYVFGYSTERTFALYANGELIQEIPLCDNGTYNWKSKFDIMIGGDALSHTSVNAYIDKVQFYAKALSQAEVKECMNAPLLSNESLLGYWDFEEGCIVGDDGFMTADNGSIEAVMYNILQDDYVGSIGKEIAPFSFGEGVDVSEVTGIGQAVSITTISKAYVANGVLNIENSDGINMVEVYDTTGRLLVSTNGGGETSKQISLPTYAKGVLMVKVNSEALKVVAKTM